MGVTLLFDTQPLSNTLKGEIIFLDKEFKITKRIRQKEFNWLQDSIELNNQDILLIDSNNYRICRISKNGKILEELTFAEKPMKLFCFLKVDKEATEDLFNF